jgi:hypothetical protein
MSTDLAKLLGYTHPAVITHFCHEYSEYSISEGQKLFQDLLAWFYLKNERTKRGKATYLFGPLLILDKLWHIFILHTRDYTDFSLRFFGEYIHHDPEPVGFEHVLNEDELSDYLMDCFNYLDQEWVERCFAEALLEASMP